MWLKKNKTTFFFLLLCVFVQAQTTIINGRAPFHSKKEINIYLYDDLITKKEIKKAVTIIGDTGDFTFSIDIDKTQMGVLKIEKEKANLYLVPGNSYKIFFPPKDTTKYSNENIEQSTDLTFENTDSTELNSLIIDYNFLVNKFWRKNYQYFVNNRGKAKLDSFSKATLVKYAGAKNEYFQTHIKYSLASLAFNSGGTTKGAIKKYFYKQPIHYNNYEYMQLFNEVFKSYVYEHLSNKGVASGVYNELVKSSYEGIMEAMTTDTLLKEIPLRELVLLKGLQQLYYVNDVADLKQNIVSVLKQIENKTTTAEHKKIAKNIIESFEAHGKGAMAPAFELLDKNGKKVKLSDFNGKYVYIDFWATWCGPCLKEMKVIPNLKKKYGSKIVFISISEDDQMETMKNFLAKNPKYDWIFLHYGTGKKIKDDYNVKTLPTYFLIDPYGRFIAAPAEYPSGNIEREFDVIMKKTTK